MSILIYEDAAVPLLAPITTARPAFCITVGSYRLIDLLAKTEQSLVAHTRKFLQSLCELDCPSLKLTGDASLQTQPGPQLVLNARLTPSVENLRLVEQLLASDVAQPSVVWSGDQIAAIVGPDWDWSTIAAAESTGLAQLLQTAATLPKLDYELKLMSYPHDVVAANMESIGSSLEHRIASGSYKEIADGVFSASDAKIGEYVLTETQDGPIIIDEGASIGPYTLIRGPVYIGPGCRILEHAAIKDAVSLGHTTKIGGEVEAAVVEPFSNKQHHGFLGHSYLGSWINLGAGTCNSDLKNTYGTVNMEYPAGKAATGMQFLGCVMGDYSKTAINTGIFTGKVIGVCSMMYGFVTSNVPSFVNYARLFGQNATLPPEIMIATQQRMFRRRKVQQRACDSELIHDMYRITQHERDRFGDDLAF
ncbi:MAG: GlmU family protein [Aureliella sp.]